MGKFDGVLLFSDFDDTLFRSNITEAGVSEKDKREEPVVFGRNRAALDYYLSEGGLFSVATGRAHQTFSPYLGRVPMNAPAILSNGAVIYDFSTQKELCHAYLPRDTGADAQLLSDAMPWLGFETHLGGLVYTYRPNEITRRHIHKIGFPWVETTFDEMPGPWTKLLLQHEEHEALEEAARWMRERFPGKYEVIFSNHRLLEITAPGATKGQAALRVAELLHIRREDLYCIGDNQNDIPMLAVSAIPFAPANCAKEVRDFGARLVCSCDEGAIADVVDVLDTRY